MPAKSKKQYRAMQAAAHGHSNIGIPEDVAKEFVRETHDTKHLPESKHSKREHHHKKK